MYNFVDVAGKKDTSKKFFVITSKGLKRIEFYTDEKMIEARVLRIASGQGAMSFALLKNCLRQSLRDEYGYKGKIGILLSTLHAEGSLEEVSKLAARKSHVAKMKAKREDKEEEEYETEEEDDDEDEEEEPVSRAKRKSTPGFSKAKTAGVVKDATVAVTQMVSVKSLLKINVGMLVNTRGNEKIMAQILMEIYKKEGNIPLMRWVLNDRLKAYTGKNYRKLTEFGDSAGGLITRLVTDCNFLEIVNAKST